MPLAPISVPLTAQNPFLTGLQQAMQMHRQMVQQEAQLPLLEAQTGLMQERAKYLPVTAAVGAQNALNRQALLTSMNLRRGPAYQLRQLVMSMPGPARAAWEAQHQTAWNAILAKTAQDNLVQANAPDIVSGVLRNMGILPSTPPHNITSSEPHQEQTQPEKVILPSKPIEEPIQAALTDLQSSPTSQEGFQSTPAQTALTARANEIAANQAVTTTTTRQRAEAGEALEKYLSSPQVKNSFNTLSHFAGHLGEMKSLWDKLANPEAYSQYLSANQQLGSILAGGISQLEGFAKTDHGIKVAVNFFKKAKSLLGTDRQAAIDYFNRGLNLLRERNDSLQATAQPIFPGVKRIRGLQPSLLPTTRVGPEFTTTQIREELARREKVK